MKKGHVSFVSFPHPPHIGPTLPIVEVLVRRGYRVSYMTSDRFASRIEPLGAEVVLCPRFSIWDGGPTAQEHAHPCARFAVRTLPSLGSFYEANRPDLIIYDFAALAGRILAKRLGVPAIQISPVFALNPEHLLQQIAPEHAALLEHILFQGQEVDRFLAEYGITERRAFVFHREKLNIYFFPKELQLKGTLSEADCFYAGRCAGEQPYYGDWQKTSSDDRPICLVSTSTTYIRGPKFFKMCIEALRDLGWHVILSIGDTTDAASLLPLPPHFEIVQNTAHVKILPHTSLFICLGGLISQAEAMYHGVPLLVLSCGIPDLEWHAENTVEKGIGLHLKWAETSSDNLRDRALRIMRSKPILDRVAQVQRLTRLAPGGEETANRIEEMMS